MEKAKQDHSISASQVKAVGITNQRETTVIWDKNTGSPLYNAIVWCDTRTQSTCDILRKSFDSEHVRRICGLPISTYFSGVKLRWLIDHVPAVKEGIENGTALFGTVDTWLTWNLTKEKVHVTDVTNAGRTMLMNIHTCTWDDELLDIIGITRAILPEIRSNSEVYGTMVDTALESVPIAGLIGDQQSALVGQACFAVGEAKSTYGTGCFLIVNTGDLKFSNNKLLTTPAYQLGKHAPCIYSLEGSISVAGSAVKWLEEKMGLISSAKESEELARSVPDTDDVYFVPAFSGLFAPWWREDARGAIVGMTQSTSKAHIVRATLESVCFKVNTVLQAVSDDIGAPILELKVDGGMTSNNLLMQMQADIMGTSVLRSRIVETTALGAAFVAGYATGVYTSIESFREKWQDDRRFEPEIEPQVREAKIRRWNMAVERSFGWSDTAAPKAESAWRGFWGTLSPTKVSKELLVGMSIGAAGVVLLSMALKRL